MSCRAMETSNKPRITSAMVTRVFHLQKYPWQDRWKAERRGCVTKEVIPAKFCMQAEEFFGVSRRWPDYLPWVLNCSGSCLMISSGGLPPLQEGWPKPLALAPF